MFGNRFCFRRGDPEEEKEPRDFLLVEGEVLSPRNLVCGHDFCLADHPFKGWGICAVSFGSLNVAGVPK